MRKLLISCDEYAYFLNGQFYFREFGSLLAMRYLSVFDAVRFAVRTKIVHSNEELGVYTIPVIDKRIEIYPIPFFQGPKQYAQNYISIKKVVKTISKGCDAAVFRIPSTIGFVCLAAVKKVGLPFAVEVIANPIEIALNANNRITSFFMRLMHYQQLAACRDADGASYVTESTLQKIYPATKKVHFESYYSSVELSASFYTAPRQYPKQKPFVICHVSNPIKTYHKGHLTVIKVVKLLTDRGHEVVGQFAGDGEYVVYFKEFAKQLGISDKIKFVGLLKQQELKTFLESADVMLFPTKSEGLPRAVIEAMATGLPCISTRVGGIPELIPDELMCSPDDAISFANKVEEIINTPFLYEKLSAFSFRKSGEYSLEKLQIRRNMFYEKLKLSIDNKKQ